MLKIGSRRRIDVVLGLWKGPTGWPIAISRLETGIRHNNYKENEGIFCWLNPITALCAIQCNLLTDVLILHSQIVQAADSPHAPHRQRTPPIGWFLECRTPLHSALVLSDNPNGSWQALRALSFSESLLIYDGSTSDVHLQIPSGHGYSGV